jgi:hypothetical protein
MGQIMLGGEGPEDIDIPIGMGVGRENVMVRHNDQLIRVPDFGVFPEFPLEDTDRGRSTYVVCHEHVHIDPYVFAGCYAVAVGMACHYSFGNRHSFFPGVRQAHGPILYG